ncbi:hypothetical protein ACFL23_00010 [Patescibacteria group bacterium]
MRREKREFFVGNCYHTYHIYYNYIINNSLPPIKCIKLIETALQIKNLDDILRIEGSIVGELYDMHIKDKKDNYPCESIIMIKTEKILCLD